MLRFLLAMSVLWLIMASPFILIILVIVLLVRHSNKKHGQPTPEERAAYDLRQIRYNLEDLNAKKDIELWSKKNH